MKQIIIIGLIALLMLQAVGADTYIPTVTSVYFEENGQSYNGKIEFTVKGYGYGTGMPGDPDYVGKKEPGTYTPEVVYRFSATYNKYGDKIYETYYHNYVHIDYYELEGKTADGRTFIIRNIEEIPMNCKWTNSEENEEYKACLANLVKPTFVDASTQPAGTTREDYKGRIWTKGEDGWTSPEVSGTIWGDIIWPEVDKEMYEYNEAKKQCQEILEQMYSSDDYYEQECELRFNLDEADWDFTPPAPKQSFWEKIICFFKGLFNKGC